MKKKEFIAIFSILIILGLVPIVSTSAWWQFSKIKQVKIIRDDYGVPHIYANTREALAYGCGYVMAQDRLWQADLFRKQAFGNLYEFGIGSFDSDYNTRKLGYSREELREIFDKWVPTKPDAMLKEMMLAYVDGINFYISQALQAYSNGDPSLVPIEYLVNGFPLEPFTLEDCVSIVVMMAWRFGSGGGSELQYASRLQALQAMHGAQVGWEIFNDLYPQVDPGAPVTISGAGCEFPEQLGYENILNLPTNIGNVYQEYAKSQMEQLELFESMGLPTKFGSNAWMVGPSKSATGNAMQLGGPQMGHSTPQIVHEIGLHGAGIDAVGMSMPVMPTVLIGVSQHGAWTSTSGASDLMDTYIEVLNPANQYQYWYNGGWVDMEKRTERIYGPFKMTWEDRDVYRTIHGPIAAWDLDNNLCFSMKTPYYMNELAAEEGWSHFQQAENVNDVQDALKAVHASHNFFWVDREGNVAYGHAGTYPIKPTHGKDGRLIDDRLPLWGTGEEEWIGLTGWDEMPKCLNPEEGFLANWNNKPSADWTHKEADWGEVHGVQWIQEQLATGGMISFENMNDINRDTGYSHFGGMHFLDFLINAAKTDPSIPSEVIDALEAWDWHYNDIVDPKYPAADATYDDPGLTIFDKWMGKVDNEVFGDNLPPGVSGGTSTLLHVFDGVDSKLPLNFDYLDGEDRDTLIVRVLKEALAELEASYGPDVSTWLTPVRITYLWSQGALPTPKMQSMNRGTYNHIAEMPKWEWWHAFGKPPPHAVNVIPPGQSGFFSIVDGISPHAYDQLILYDTWTYKPVRFSWRANIAVSESLQYLIYFG